MKDEHHDLIWTDKDAKMSKIWTGVYVILTGSWISFLLYVLNVI